MKQLKLLFVDFLCLLLILSSSLCAFALSAKTEGPNKELPVDEIIMSYNNPNGRVLCAASLGNTLLFPENSLEGISSAIDAGADIICVKVQKTKDGRFVLFSDKTLTRMCINKNDGTPATGRVSENTLKQLQSEYRLRESRGSVNSKPTKYKIPSFEEAVELCRDKVLLMVNNGFAYADELNVLARSLDACDLIILRGAATPSEADAFKDKVGVPVCHICSKYTDASEGSAKKFVVSSLESGINVVELSSAKKHGSIFRSSLLKNFGNAGRAFVSTTKKEYCGGRDDLRKDWALLIERGYSIIETDYPKELAGYINSVESYRAELTGLIRQAQGLNMSSYTAESAGTLKKALKAAESASSKGCISLTQIDKARYDIQEALNDLTVKTGNEKTSLPFWLKAVICLACLLAVSLAVIFALRLFNKKRAQARRMKKFSSAFKDDMPYNGYEDGGDGEDRGNDE